MEHKPFCIISRNFRGRYVVNMYLMPLLFLLIKKHKIVTGNILVMICHVGIWEQSFIKQFSEINPQIKVLCHLIFLLVCKNAFISVLQIFLCLRRFLVGS